MGGFHHDRYRTVGSLCHDKTSSRKTFLAVILSLGFLAFAYENYDALNDIARARIATRDLIWGYSGKDAAQEVINLIKPTITPPSIRGLRLFHIILDVVVLAAIWGFTLIKEESPNHRPPRS
jgi:hypothetical protein